MITFQKNIKLVKLPNPVFNDTVNTNRSVLIKKTRSQKRFTYLTGDSNFRDFNLTFQNVSRANFESFKAFYIAEAGSLVDYTDKDGLKRRVRLLAEPLSVAFNTSGTHTTFNLLCQEQ